MPSRRSQVWRSHWRTFLRQQKRAPSTIGLHLRRLAFVDRPVSTNNTRLVGLTPITAVTPDTCERSRTSSMSIH